MSKVWLVTGANSGLGRAITEDAIAAGDVVIAGARRPHTLHDLAAAYPDQVEPVALDVTDHQAIERVVADVVARHGRIDVLVNNAGRGHVGAVEETTDAELRSVFDVNVFGPAALTRAVLPHMRARRSGAIVQISSQGGQLAFSGFSAYCSTKFALEGLSEALAQEVEPLGIKVLIVEPGQFRTSLFGNGTVSDTQFPDYADTVGPKRAVVDAGDGAAPGDPAKAAAAIRTALDAPDTPLRLPLGPDAVDAILAHLEALRTNVTTWETTARATDFTPALD
ncbi:NAD(P)-dependent dehydrogenase (short-subunit alcohol dehydrogenase family) [Kitasatospora sp. MAA4]|uniref:oxidoreductase n=1 Tax=Kitasatospora sp. MAA4 TaxID=3035093 RepID=UPI0024757010|nr:oxidoreductase [Kitasatospora sp. MAA4]MDH6130804.1 NAD(P)-dependent dehydrogenase (short-subunit alcohol dehydrogenase family) [Kitasatospora sp. MAA4]